MGWRNPQRAQRGSQAPALSGAWTTLQGRAAWLSGFTLASHRGQEVPILLLSCCTYSSLTTAYPKFHLPIHCLQVAWRTSDSTNLAATLATESTLPGLSPPSMAASGNCCISSSPKAALIMAAWPTTASMQGSQLSTHHHNRLRTVQSCSSSNSSISIWLRSTPCSGLYSSKQCSRPCIIHLATWL